MTFGILQEDISALYTPTKLYDFSGAEVLECVKRPEYMMRKISLKMGGVLPAAYFLQAGGVYFVEEGEVLLKKRKISGEVSAARIGAGGVFSINRGEIHGLCGLCESILYFFGHAEPLLFAETEKEADSYFLHFIKRAREVEVESEKTTNFREKYWGFIETILDGEICGKRIVMKAGTQSSLEYHCHKMESYFVHTGALKVGLRVGRGENTSVVVHPGQSFDVIPGLMHMRIALEESVVFEVSTKDTDRDSHLVEDGMTYTHIEAK